MNIQVGDKLIVTNANGFHSSVQQGAQAKVICVMSYGIDVNIEGCTANPQFASVDWLHAHFKPTK